jgi:hypothetical protein
MFIMLKVHIYSINGLQKMERGQHGANGILVPDHVTEGTKPELGHVPIHRLTTSVKIRSVVIAVTMIHGDVTQRVVHVRFS